MQTIKETRIEGARNQRVVIELDESDWMVMYDDGSVNAFGTAEAAFKSVAKAAKKGNKTITITSIEWRNVPDGFKPPPSEWQ